MGDPADIGKTLRLMYEAGPLGDEPVPEKFLALLIAAEAREAEERKAEKEEKKQDG